MRRNNIPIPLTLALIIGVLLALSAIAFEAWCWITYGSKPVGEIPGWIAYFMFKGGK